MMRNSNVRRIALAASALTSAWAMPALAQGADDTGTGAADVVAPRLASNITSGNGAGVGSMFDLQNVQALKGPQGTLFGRNTTGGAILLVPQRPTDRSEERRVGKECRSRWSPY